jgi:hypothetical protein
MGESYEITGLSLMCGERAAEEEMGEAEEITSLSDPKHENKTFTSSSLSSSFCLLSFFSFVFFYSFSSHLISSYSTLSLLLPSCSFHIVSYPLPYFRLLFFFLFNVLTSTTAHSGPERLCLNFQFLWESFVTAKSEIIN